MATTALIVGLAYAAISAYWALGGTWLLATVSASPVTTQQSASVVVAVWAAVVFKVGGALLPFYICRPASRSKWHRRLRVLAWVKAAVLISYGLVFTSVGLLVQVGIINPGKSADRNASAWHAYLWDPWFLVWGLLVATALALTPTHSNPHRYRYRS